MSRRRGRALPQRLCKLEWYVGKVAIAVDDTPFSIEEFSAIDPDALPNMLLTLQSGLNYLNASWPVDELMTLYLTKPPPDRFGFGLVEGGKEGRGEGGSLI